MRVRLVCFAATALFAWRAFAELDISGSSAFEQRYFLQDALYTQQSRTQASAFIQPEIYLDWNDGYDSLLFKPFYRIDQRDEERTHGDIRELMWLHVGDDWELRTGVGKVFWGQTESVHLVDVINQTDLVESVDGEDKLGQPMVNFSLIRDWGTTSVFVLPYFRERTFSGWDGRLRAELAIDVDNPIYESADEQENVDWAIRWQHSIGDWEVGLSYFDGTSREPYITTDVTTDGVSLRPWYVQMQQFGLDVLAIYNAWLLKLEAIHRKTTQEAFYAAVAGFEYTSVGVMNTIYDIGWLLEYQYDERDENSILPSIAQNDIMLGARFVFNDVDGTEVLVALVQDLDHSNSRSGFVEASSRISDNWKWNFNAYLFSSDVSNDPVSLFRRDDFVEFGLEYYF